MSTCFFIYCRCRFPRPPKRFNECIEPYTSNLYARRVKAGEFIVVNPHLFTDLMEMGLWSPSVRNQLMASGGSIASIVG